MIESRNGHAKQPATLEELQAELAIANARNELAAAKLINEAWSPSYTGLNYGDFVDPMDAFRDVDIVRGNPIGNRLDRLDGRNRPFVWTDLDLDMIRGQARWVSTRNGYALSGLSNLSNYVIKDGYQWQVMPKKQWSKDKTYLDLAAMVEESLEEFDCLNADRNVSPHGPVKGLAALEKASFWRSRVEGESFIRFFKSPDADGGTILRDIEPESVRMPLGSPADYLFGIYTPPPDIWTAREYAVCYESPTEPEFVPAGEIAHLKLNVPRSVKRGLSDFYGTAETFDLAWKLVRNMTTSGGVQAAIAWIEQYDQANQANVQANVQAARDQNRYYPPAPVTGKPVNFERFEPGTMLKVGKGKTYTAAPLAQNTTQHLGILAASLRALASRWCMPEYMMGADASNANYASTLVSGSPFVNKCESEQAAYLPFFAGWRWTAIRNYANAGRYILNGHVWTFAEIQKCLDLHGTPPQVAIASKAEEAVIDAQDMQLGVLSKQTRRAKLGLDDDKETTNLRAEPVVPAPAPERTTERIQPGQGGGGLGGFFPRLNTAG